MSAKVIWSNMSVRSSVFLLIFSLDDLSIDENIVNRKIDENIVNRKTEVPTIIVLLSISLFKSVNICLI